MPAPIDRRQFLKGSAAAAALAPFAACRINGGGAARSPNEEIRIAVAGLRGRGQSHIQGFHSQQNVRVVALCDVDRKVLEQRAGEFEKNGDRVDRVVDFRELLDRQDIDAVALATPNHWHALQTIWACQAGKDVYVEKPASHNLFEGVQMVAAARRHGRIVQVGTQARSSTGIAEAFRWIQAGKLGPIQLARGLCYKPRKSIGKVSAPTPVPEHIDYDLWVGPAPMKPLQREALHYDWHWVFDTGNGDLGNQGVHQMDLCRWALGVDTLPRAAFGFGGRLGYDDDGDTPNTFVSFLDYERAPILFEVRGLPRDLDAQQNNWGGGMDDYLGARIGVVIHCEGGTLRVTDYGSARAYDPDGKVIETWKGSDNHFQNFIQGMRSRRTEDLNSEIHEGHLSAALCHMGNISYRVGSPGEGRRFQVSEAVLESVGRMRQHLERNGVDGGEIRYGAWLSYDSRRGRFSASGDGDRDTLERANALLTRDYREPFVVPAKT